MRTLFLEYDMTAISFGIFSGKVVSSLPFLWRLVGRSRLVYRGWLYDDLAGFRPEHHPELIRRDSDGEVIVERGQVWVELQNAKLWRVMQISDPWPQGVRRVHLGRYRAEGIDYQLSEIGLRGSMKIWGS